jgi:hypothetical protein
MVFNTVSVHSSQPQGLGVPEGRVGALVGLEVGELEGLDVGDADGCNVGDTVGETEGKSELPLSHRVGSHMGPQISSNSSLLI